MAVVLPAGGPRVDLMIGTLYINGGGVGWAEKHFISTPQASPPTAADYTDATNRFFKICTTRSWLLAAGFTIVWARVSSTFAVRDSVAAIAGPIVGGLLADETPPEAVLEVCNEPDDALLYRFEDGVGRFGQRMVRGLRDSWITDTKAVGALTGPIFGPGTYTAGGYANPTVKNRGNVLNNYLVSLQENTIMAAKKVAGPNNWITFPLTNVIYRYAANRKSGNPFQRSHGRAASRV